MNEGRNSKVRCRKCCQLRGRESSTKASGTGNVKNDLGVHKYAADLELAAHVVDDSLRVRPSSVQLVDERYPRHRVSLHLPVDGEGLRLHP